MRWPWQQTETQRAEAAAQEAWARVAEATASNVERQLAEEDVGWTKLTDVETGYDLTTQALANIRQRCRQMWRIDSTVGAADMLLASGTFGQGISTPNAPDDAVQKILTEHWDDDDNQLALYSHAAMLRTNSLLMTDGERFLTLHTSASDWRMKIGEIEPEQIVQVVSAPNNKLRIAAYARRHRQSQYDPQTASYRSATGEQRLTHYMDWRIAQMIAAGPGGAGYDAELVEWVRALPNLQEDVSIYHVRAPGLGTRGMPEIYRAYDWLRASSQALSALVTWTRAQAAIAWQQRRTITTAAQLARAASAAQSTGGVAGVQIHNDGMEMKPVDVSTGGAQNLQAAVRQTLLPGIRPFGFGEHYYGDASSGKYTTAANMELPAIWRINARQTLFRAVLVDIVMMALRRAQRFRQIPPTSDLYFDLDFPSAEPSTPQTVHLGIMALVQGLQAGLLEPREAAYHAYLLLGTNDIDRVLDEQFGVEGTVPPVIASVAEALRQDTPADRLARRFQRELQARVITPWHEQVRAWLLTQGETIPEPAILASQVSMLQPDGRLMLEIIERYSVAAANLGGQQAINRLQRALQRAAVREAPTQFVLADPALLRALKQRGEKITGEVTQSMLDDLHTVLQMQYYDEGLGPVAVARDLDNIFPPTYAARAETIARTETFIAQMETLHETYRRNGVRQKQWAAFIDDKTRDSHADANGQVRDFDEPFDVGGVQLMHPGDPSGPAAEIINCRCDELPVIDGDETVIWLGGDA